METLKTRPSGMGFRSCARVASRRISRVFGPHHLRPTPGMQVNQAADSGGRRPVTTGERGRVTVTAPIETTGAAAEAQPEAVLEGAGEGQIEGRSLGQIAWTRFKK